MKDIISVIEGKDKVYKLKGADIKSIENAQKELDVTFSADYTKYVETFGAISYYRHELTGVCSVKTLNVVNVTNNQREIDSDVSAGWYVIEQTHYDDIAIWQAKDGKIYSKAPGIKAKEIADSLGEYIEKY